VAALKEAGRGAVHLDGTFDMFAGDIVAAGADGLCFEPSNDFRSWSPGTEGRTR